MSKEMKTIEYEYLFNYFGGDKFENKTVTGASVLVAVRPYKEAEAYKGYNHFTLLDGKVYESCYTDIWFSPDRVHGGKDIPCAVLLQTSLDLNKKRSYGFGYTMTVRYEKEDGLMDIFSNIINRSLALCIKDIVKVLPKYADDWKKYIDKAACIETARGVF